MVSGSVFCQSILSLVSGSVFCRFIRSLASGSLLCRFIRGLVLGLVHAWEGCLPHRFLRLLARGLRAASRTWKRWWHSSALVRFLFEREGLLSRIWPESFCCRALSLLLNLPVAVLHCLYVKLRPCCDSSLVCRFFFSLGEQVPLAIGWVMLLCMSIEYAYWSNAYSLIGFVLLLLLFLAGGMRRRSLRLDLAGLGPYWALLFLAVCLSCPLSAYPELSWRYLPYYITCALCVLLTVSSVETAGQLERLAGFACLGVVGSSLWGIFQRVQGMVVVNVYFVDTRLNPDVPGRIYSFYDNPNAFAQMLVMLIPVGVALLLGSRRWYYRLTGLISAGLGTAALIMTYSRSAWVGLAAAAVVFLFFWKRKLVPVLAVAGLACLPLLPEAILQRVLSIFDSNDSSTISRVPLMRAGVDMIKLHPLLGVGLGGDAVRQATQDLAVYAPNQARFTHTHNLYLQLWLEHGLLGIAAFVAGCWRALKTGAAAFQREDGARSTRLIVLGATSALVGSLVSGLADYLFNYPRVMLIFWFSVSLLLAGAKLIQRGERTKKITLRIG